MTPDDAFRLADPWWLCALAMLPALWALRARRKPRAVLYSGIALLKDLPKTARQRLIWLPVALRDLGLALLIIAAARPQLGAGQTSIVTNGVAMMMVLDRSSSMGYSINSPRQGPSRLSVVRQAAEQFVTGSIQPQAQSAQDDALVELELQGRPNDMIGLVSFAGYAATAAPLSRSHDVLAQQIRSTDIVQTREEDGTAIGDAIALAAARLDRAEENLNPDDDSFTINSKVIILLTDGDETTYRMMRTREAADLCAELGIKIYAVGIVDRFGRGANAQLLRDIAEKTGGAFATVRDSVTLLDVYRQIDELEKTEIETISYTNYAEQYMWLAAPGLGALTLGITLSSTLLRRWP